MGLPIVGDVLGTLGASSANQEQRKYLNSSMDRLKTGAANASGFQQPVYDTSLGNFQNLSQQQANGGFKMPTSTAYDPGQFNFDFKADPGYNFALNQGLDSIKGQAAQGGMEHSPQTSRALIDYATGKANQEYNQDYNRSFNQFTNQRDFGFGAQNQAWNQNFQNNNADFARGQSLTGFLPGSANYLSGIQTGLGQGLAEIEEQKGGLSAQNAALPWAVGQNAAANINIPGLPSWKKMPTLVGGGDGLGGGSATKEMLS